MSRTRILAALIAVIRTPWGHIRGYIRAREVRAPRAGACTSIPLAFDVRNACLPPLAVDVRVITDMADRVIQGNTVKVCGSDWTAPRLGISSLVAYKGVKKGRYVHVVTEFVMGGTTQLHTSLMFMPCPHTLEVFSRSS